MRRLRSWHDVLLTLGLEHRLDERDRIAVPSEQFVGAGQKAQRPIRILVK